MSDSQPQMNLFGLLIIVALVACMFQYNVYTFCAKDVSFFLDMLAGLILVIPTLGTNVRPFAYLNTMTFLVCVVGRFILDFPAPWIK